MTSNIRIAIDVMGGDEGLHVSLPAAVQSLQQNPSLFLHLVGDVTAIEQHLNLPEEFRVRVALVHAEQSIAMEESPLSALRHKKQSSIHKSLELMSSGEADAMVSAGNTGALMAIAYKQLGTLPMIERPAICSAVPSRSGFCLLLDLGANVENSAEQLSQFAAMGSAMFTALTGRAEPRVALLNMGQEAGKGGDKLNQADAILKAQSAINYQGFIEGHHVFDGNIDIAVCEGLVGNVALKSCEGLADYIKHTIKTEFATNWRGQLSAWLIKPLMKDIFYKLDPQTYNGASLLGLNGIVVKSHGASNVNGYANAIQQAYSEANKNMLVMIEQHLKQLM